MTVAIIPCTLYGYFVVDSATIIYIFVSPVVVTYDVVSYYQRKFLKKELFLEVIAGSTYMIL